MRILLIGYGYWGKIWEKTIKKSDNILVDIIDLYFFNNNLADINLESYDSAIIVTPINSHFENAKFLIKNNKNVLIEKPGTHNIQCIQELIDINSVKNIGIGYVLLYSTGIQKIKQSMQLWNYAQFFRSNGSSQIRKDCNIIYDLLCHDIAVAYYIFECIPIVLFSDKTADVVNCILKFENTICYFYCTRLDKQKLSHFRFISESQTYDYDDIDKKLTSYNGEEEKIEIFKEYPLDNQLKYLGKKFIADLNFGKIIHEILVKI